MSMYYRHHHRRSIRLKGYDYSRPGAYFVTICAQNRKCLFGDVVGGEMVLNDAGKMADLCWREIPVHYPNVILDSYVIMPNHVHGIIIISNGTVAGARHAVPLQNAVPLQEMHVEQFGKPTCGTIPTIVRSYKSVVTKHINEIRQTPGAVLWQRNYHEWIVRNDRSLNRFRGYIIDNPRKWEYDRHNPDRIMTAAGAVLKNTTTGDIIMNQKGTYGPRS